MTGAARRDQLVDIARTVFAERGFDGASIEDIAARAEVSKPVVYEHFGGKEGLYAVVVDREVRQLLTMMRSSLTAGHARELLEQAACALLDYIEQSSDGFRILVRDSPIGSESGSFVSIIGDIAGRVEHILAAEFSRRGFDPTYAPMYAQMLVGHGGVRPASGGWTSASLPRRSSPRTWSTWPGTGCPAWRRNPTPAATSIPPIRIGGKDA